MSVLVATQITAIATAVLGVGAIVTAVFAFLAFRKQSAEVGILQQQTADQAGVLETGAEGIRSEIAVIRDYEDEPRYWPAHERQGVAIEHATVNTSGDADGLYVGGSHGGRPMTDPDARQLSRRSRSSSRRVVASVSG
jgi:hypothetical protein